jgi:hypothetical protein
MKVSGYTTVKNAVEMEYPFEESIRSVLAFADEVVVLNSSNKDDGTTARLNAMAEADPRVKHHITAFPWDAPNHGIYDGESKASARKLCTGDYLYQFDIDEIVHEKHAEMIRPLIQRTDWNSVSLLALPVVDFWGRNGNVRIDVNLWKWRLSKNLPNITHGIPAHLRKIENGLLYAKHGTDGCDYIDKKTGNVVPCALYMPNKIELLKRQAVFDSSVVPVVESYVNVSLEKLPGVFHYSWFNIERKIRNFRSFWNLSWKSLYNEERDEKTNPFFPGLMWSEVTDQMISDKARELETKTGGHVFHSPWNGLKTNSIRVKMDHPKIIQPWVEQQKKQ